MSLIEEYLEKVPVAHQEKSKEMYHLLKKLLPEAQERLTYGMPTFYLHENLVHFAPTKKHLGFYPSPSPIVAFKEQLVPFKTSKGAIQFSYDQPLPKELIESIVLFRKKEVLGDE
ncbi:iron chaperone [Enterococcus alcedinis]|uniref:YdhG-like domain-containing protein n=1 Tax=Enterococcus alcedinis TaxID=1274384 RepID=A0A917N5L2_9ENTE|nr:DUF1801 domain-containing protein [Enterococcus alcedinis]MBP2100880.1 uncharacterized protein YdhG (YjbR/CyaY superfamily) [Enterococcus alcedinis]GGI64822.1 hypothetical protein GCM10011482_04760 [Enterococcus alcedinis]